jgi:hypothetical protein
VVTSRLLQVVASVSPLGHLNELLGTEKETIEVRPDVAIEVT